MKRWSAGKFGALRRICLASGEARLIKRASRGPRVGRLHRATDVVIPRLAKRVEGPHQLAVDHTHDQSVIHYPMEGPAPSQPVLSERSESNGQARDDTWLDWSTLVSAEQMRCADPESSPRDEFVQLADFRVAPPPYH